MIVETRDVVMAVGLLGGPIAVYVGMRTSVTRLETQLAAMMETLRELKDGRSTHSESIGGVRETQANHEARIGALEQRPPCQCQAHGRTNADQSGGHRAR